MNDTVHARSRRPIFQGQRFIVFDWMLEDLSRLLGAHTEDFDLHGFFFELDAKVAGENVVIPQRDGGRWLQAQVLAEAIRRGLPVANLDRRVMPDRRGASNPSQSRVWCEHEPRCETISVCTKRVLNEARAAAGRPLL